MVQSITDEKVNHIDTSQVKRKLAVIAKEYTSVSSSKGILSVFVHWLCVAIIYFLLISFNFRWEVSILAFIAISKIQNSLLLLGHEAIHGLLLQNKTLNDFVSQYFCFAPMGVGCCKARKAHLDHHRYLFTEGDEEIDIQTVKPQTRNAFLRHIFAPLFGEYAIRFTSRFLPLYKIKSQYKQKFELLPSEAKLDFQSIIIVNIILLLILIPINWKLYVFFWFLPIITLTAFGHKVKAFCDHARLKGEPEDSLNTFKPTLLDRLIFGTQQAYHAEHHLMPTVPYYDLPKLSETAKLLPNIIYRKGYFEYLKQYYQDLN